MDPQELRELTAHIVSAYVEKNRIPASELPALVASVSASVAGLGGAAPVAVEAPTPAVNPKKSVHEDHIVCLEDGKKFKSLKRHLGSEHGMTPDEYRARWGLSGDYPMVAPGYAAARSELAKKMGLGRKPKEKPKAKRTRAKSA